jgi:hypothetical protein
VDPVALLQEARGQSGASLIRHNKYRETDRLADAQQPEGMKLKRRGADFPPRLPFNTYDVTPNPSPLTLNTQHP